MNQSRVLTSFARLTKAVRAYLEEQKHLLAFKATGVIGQANAQRLVAAGSELERAVEEAEEVQREMTAAS